MHMFHLMHGGHDGQYRRQDITTLFSGSNTFSNGKPKYGGSDGGAGVEPLLGIADSNGGLSFESIYERNEAASSSGGEGAKKKKRKKKKKLAKEGEAGALSSSLAPTAIVVHDLANTTTSAPRSTGSEV